jgi:hypothetical protein
MMDKALTIRNNDTAIANYGDMEAIRDLAGRIKSMMPGGSRYTDDEAMTLAQISVAHELDPFNGECWLIKDPDSGKVYGALIGIKGHRKHAKRQSNYWGEFVRVTDPGIYNAPQGSIVFEYRVYDDANLEAYSRRAEKFIKLGFNLDQIIKMIGRPPCTVGVGIWSPGDRTKMKPAQAAMFRAEKDALKRRFDVMFRAEINGKMLPVGAADSPDEEREAAEIEAEYTEVDDEPRDEDEILEELGFEQGAAPEPEPQPVSEQAVKNGTRPYPPLVLKERIAAIAKQLQNQQFGNYDSGVLASCLETTLGGETQRHELLLWLTGAASLKEIPPGYGPAMLKWLGVTDYNQPPSEEAMQEARQAHAEALKAAGQQTLGI